MSFPKRVPLVLEERAMDEIHDDSVRLIVLSAVGRPDTHAATSGIINSTPRSMGDRRHRNSLMATNVHPHVDP